MFIQTIEYISKVLWWILVSIVTVLLFKVIFEILLHYYMLVVKQSDMCHPKFARNMDRTSPPRSSEEETARLVSKFLSLSEAPEPSFASFYRWFVLHSIHKRSYKSGAFKSHVPWICSGPGSWKIETILLTLCESSIISEEDKLIFCDFLEEYYQLLEKEKIYPSGPYVNIASWEFVKRVFDMDDPRHMASNHTWHQVGKNESDRILAAAAARQETVAAEQAQHTHETIAPQAARLHRVHQAIQDFQAQHAHDIATLEKATIEEAHQAYQAQQLHQAQHTRQAQQAQHTPHKTDESPRTKLTWADHQAHYLSTLREAAKNSATISQKPSETPTPEKLKRMGSKRVVSASAVGSGSPTKKNKADFVVREIEIKLGTGLDSGFHGVY